MILLDLFCGAGGCSVGYHRNDTRSRSCKRTQSRPCATFAQASRLSLARTAATIGRLRWGLTG